MTQVKREVLVQTIRNYERLFEKLEPLTELCERLYRPWGAVGHLMAMANTPELRAATTSRSGPMALPSSAAG